MAEIAPYNTKEALTTKTGTMSASFARLIDAITRKLNNADVEVTSDTEPALNRGQKGIWIDSAHGNQCYFIYCRADGVNVKKLLDD